MTDKSKAVGILGLGIMGSAMARNLLRAGYNVLVHNRTEFRAKALCADGAVWAGSAREAAEACDFIIVMVSDPDAVWNMASGERGFLSAAGAGKVIIQCSTLDVQTVIALAKKTQESNFGFLDAPVTGSKKQAEAAELVFEVGGETSLLQAVQPVLSVMGRHIVHAGGVGAGTALKLCMNLVVAQMTTGLCEAAALARALGIDARLIFEVLENAPALNCAYYQIKKAPILSRKYPPAFSLANMLKDVRFMNKESAGMALELPVTTAVQRLMEDALGRGWGKQDLTVIAELLTAGK